MSDEIDSEYFSDENIEIIKDKARKQGALEELTLIRNQLDVLPNRHFKEYLRNVLIKRINELKEGCLSL